MKTTTDSEKNREEESNHGGDGHQEGEEATVTPNVRTKRRKETMTIRLCRKEKEESRSQRQADERMRRQQEKRPRRPRRGREKQNKTGSSPKQGGTKRAEGESGKETVGAIRAIPSAPGPRPTGDVVPAGLFGDESAGLQV